MFWSLYKTAVDSCSSGTDPAADAGAGGAGAEYRPYVQHPAIVIHTYC